MAIAFVSSTVTTYASRTNITITAPAGLANGHLIEVAIFTGITGTPVAPSAPDGTWTSVGTTPNVTDGGGFHGFITVFRKIASGEGASWTFTHTTESSQGMALAYSGVDSAMVDVTPASNSGTGSTTSWSSVTTVSDGDMIVLFEHNWGDTANNLSPPTGYTERVDNTLIYACDQLQATHGATGTPSHTNNNTNAGSPWGTWTTALKAAPAADTGYVVQEDGTSHLLLEDNSGALIGEHFAGSGSQAAAGTVAGSSSTSGTVTAALKAAAVVAGVSVLAGTVTANLQASGSVAAVSSASGDATVTRTAGTVAATSSVSGSVTANLAASGTVAATSSTSGSTLVLASGTVAGISGTSGTVTAKLAASGSVAGVSSTAGTIAARLPASGTVAAVSGVTGDASPPGTYGTVNAVSGTSGTVTAKLAASGVIAGISTVSGTVSAHLNAAGTVTGTSGVVGGVTGRYVVVGSTAATSAVSGAVTASLQAQGVVAATSTVSGSAASTSAFRDITLVGSLLPQRVTGALLAERLTGVLVAPRLAGDLADARLTGELTAQRITGTLED